MASSAGRRNCTKTKQEGGRKGGGQVRKDGRKDVDPENCPIFTPVFIFELVTREPAVSQRITVLGHGPSTDRN